MNHCVLLAHVKVNRNLNGNNSNDKETVSGAKNRENNVAHKEDEDKENEVDRRRLNKYDGLNTVHNVGMVEQDTSHSLKNRRQLTEWGPKNAPSG